MRVLEYICALSFILSSIPAYAGEETLWEACDDLDKRAPRYAQRAWSPDAFKQQEIGIIEICRENKLVGDGSIRWVVTREDVDRKIEENPRFNTVMINYLYGQRFDHYTELRFNIKCESPGHPPLRVMLYGTGGKFPSRQILARDEVTDGWKEIRWNLEGVDIGESERRGRIMNFFRIYASAGWFEEGDELELYLDNMRLVTAPVEDLSRPLSE